MAPPLDSAAGWAGLSPPWRCCFELAWESYRAGSLPVGAVVVDPDGAIIAFGRNRYVEPNPPAGQLGGTYLAHAEINALLGLRSGEYHEHRLYTTLEPCLLCTAALIHCHVGQVHFAATDHLWRGLERLPELNHHVARRWPARVGPLAGPLAVWAGVLPLLWALDRSPEGVVVTAHEQHAIAVLELARRLQRAKPPELEQGTLSEALRAVWPRLLQVSGEPWSGCDDPDDASHLA